MPILEAVEAFQEGAGPVDEGSTGIGQNVRRARRYRGMSLAVLAGLIGRSKGWLSLVENGHLPLERRKDIAAIADALEVSAVDLLGAPDPVMSMRRGGADVTTLRDVLLDTTINDPPDVPARPVEVIAGLVDGPIRQAYREARYADVARSVPAVVAELHVHAAGGAEQERRAALALLVEACTAATFCLRQLAQPDLAWVAADRAAAAAAALGEPLPVAAAWFVRAHARPTAGQSRALRTAASAADALEPHLGSDVRAHQVYGMLRLSAALAAQLAGDCAGMENHAAEAARVADRIGDRPDSWQSFGPANVDVWRTMLAIEAGDPAAALDHARVADPAARKALAAAFPGCGRRAELELETGRAYAMLGGHDGQAVAYLRRAEHIDPVRVRNNPLARDLVSSMLARSRREAGGRELRGLAYRMGVA